MGTSEKYYPVIKIKLNEREISCGQRFMYKKNKEYQFLKSDRKQKKQKSTLEKDDVFYNISGLICIIICRYSFVVFGIITL